MAKKIIKLDKYAQDARSWKHFGKHNYAASTYLFQSHNRFLIFAAATLGHHALEMFLKAALVSEGATVFDPKKLRYLDPPVKPQAADCVWGHHLVVLARQLEARRPELILARR
jgi:hypothetical protein